jgi:hypothetical protein
MGHDTEQRVRVYGDMAINTGTYTFSNVRDGQAVTIPARFSFVYRQRNGRWMSLRLYSSRIDWGCRSGCASASTAGRS